MRRRNSLQWTLALLVTSLMLYIPANLMPIMVTEALGNTSQALPFTVIVDKNGMISVVKLGMLSEEELDRKLAELTRS